MKIWIVNDLGMSEQKYPHEMTDRELRRALENSRDDGYWDRAITMALLYELDKREGR